MEQLVSVVVPVYNMDKLVEKCIESVLVQTYKNIELLLVDDGSTDNSGQICDRVALENDRVKVFHKKNGGVADATNVGLDNVSGKYILFVDSDDYIMPTMIEKMVSALERESADIVQCGIRLIDENGNVIDNQMGKACVIEDRKEILKEYFYDTKIGNNLACKLYKSELFSDIRLSPGRSIVDLTTVPPLLNKCNKYVIVEDCFYCNIKTVTSVSRGEFTYKKFDDMMYSTEFLGEFVTKNCPEYNSFLYYNNIYTAVRCFVLIKRNGKFTRDKEKELIDICNKLFKDNYFKYKKTKEIGLGTRSQQRGFIVFNISSSLYYMMQKVRWSIKVK